MADKHWSDRPIAIAGGILGIIVAIGGLFSLGYTVGKDAGQAKVEIYEAADRLDFPKLAAEARDATAAMTAATAEFKQLLVDNRTYTEMKANLAQTQAEVADLSRVRTDLAAAQKRIADLTPSGELVTIPEGGAFDAANEVNIGLSEWYDGWAILTVNNQRYEVKAGSVETFDGTKGGSCEIKTMNLDIRDQIVVRVTCKGPAG